MAFWVIALVVNVVVMLCYLGIAFLIGRGVHTTGQWRSNPLAVATFLIFLSCGVGHGVHAQHLLMPSMERASARIAADWHLAAIDFVTAGIAIYYFLMRARFPALLQSTAMYEDLDARRRQALDIHDNIVQQLATAKLALETGHTELGMKALAGGLESSKAIITDLIGDNPASTATSDPGGLRRRESAPAARHTS